MQLSDEAKKAYEEMMQKRDAKQKQYGTHLDPGMRRQTKTAAMGPPFRFSGLRFKSAG
jgi:hypothetical protein